MRVCRCSPDSRRSCRRVDLRRLVQADRESGGRAASDRHRRVPDCRAAIIPATLTTDPFTCVLFSCLAVFGLELTVGVSWALPLDIGARLRRVGIGGDEYLR